MSGEALREQVDRLAALPRVRLALAADVEEGLVVCVAGDGSDRAEAVAALLGSLYRRAVRAAEAYGAGELRTVRLDCGEEHVLAAGTESTVLVVVAGHAANLGRVRLALLQGAEAVT